MPKVSFDRQRENVLQLLKDRANDLTSGSMIKDFAEMGAHQGGGDVFTAEYIKRYFGRPVDKTNADAEYVEHLRGASHVLMEKYLQELKRTAPLLWRKVDKIFPREGGGDRDYDWWKKLSARLREKARRISEMEGAEREEPAPPREGGRVSDAAVEAYASKRWADRVASRALIARAKEAEKDLYLCDLGVDLLTLLCLEEDLFVEFARARSAQEDAQMEEQNAAIAADYEDLKAKPGTSEKDAAETVAVRNGISAGRVRQIAEGQRLARGEEKRKPGRPRKMG